MFRCCLNRSNVSLSTIRFRTNMDQRSIHNTSSRYVLLVIPITAFCLGTWQIKRLAWKKELIREMEARTTSEAIPLPSDILSPRKIEEMEYRRVIVRGKFDHTKEVFLGPRSKNVSNSFNNSSLISSRSESGYHIVTPFVLNTGERILVNRGWVPLKMKSSLTRVQGQIEKEVELTGLIRKGEKRPQFTPSVKSDSLTFHYCDLDTFSTILNTNPVLIDADFASSVEGGPLGGQTRVNIRNEHLQYIVTWYSLSAATFYMFSKIRK
ncbi:surfeit locus protein 1 [Hydra vulgaris]|uniref:SURF1-like protein n=1 Tax=Hydra vulgaris TaxID=6087 RepID=A0ABM4BR35_HYDVU